MRLSCPATVRLYVTNGGAAQRSTAAETGETTGARRRLRDSPAGESLIQHLHRNMLVSSLIQETRSCPAVALTSLLPLPFFLSSRTDLLLAPRLQPPHVAESFAYRYPSGGWTSIRQRRQDPEQARTPHSREDCLAMQRALPNNLYSLPSRIQQRQSHLLRKDALIYGT